MAQSATFATKLPVDLIALLQTVCERLGLRKNFLVETSIREKLEDLLDAEDLQTAMREASGFHEWKAIKKQHKLS